MGILAADEKVEIEKIDSYVLIGELSLDGTLQPVKGALPIALRAREEGFRGLVQPLKNARETTRIHSVAGKIDGHTALMTRRPFRSLHHTISDVAFSNYAVLKYI
jgi:predicted ATPase with chaperone activity